MGNESDLNINEIIAHYLDNNLERLVKMGTKVLKGAKNSIRLKLKSSYTNYFKNVSEKYAKTKSFFIRDEPVLLTNFYVPLSISLNKKNLGTASHDLLSTLGNNFVLTGTAGCGKSILMKYLFLDTLKSSDRIPIFIEMRDLNREDIDLKSLIQTTLEINKLNFDNEYFERAFDSGHFIFFLDGFDEIALSKRDETSNSIQKLSQVYENNIFIVSSRQDNEFSGWKNFSVLTINNLKVEEACNLVEKLPFDVKTKERFIEELKDTLFEKHKSFLSNPLLLSIMLLTFGQSSDIPNKLSVFYNQAYEALFQRHDSFKGAFQRDRKCILDIQDFSRIFATFCIQTYDKREFQFSRTSSLEYLRTSKKIVNLKFSERNFLDDALKSSCLLIEDGLFITFSHRSFQEYFVARFIKDSNQNVRKQLLKKYISNLRSDNVFVLLYELNPEMLEKEFILPEINELFDLLKIKNKIGITHFERFIKLCFTEIEVDTEMLFGRNLSDNKVYYYDFVSFVVDKCAHLVGFNGFPKKRKNDFSFTDKYDSFETFPLFQLSDYSYRSEFIRDLFEYGRLFSKDSLVLVSEIKAALIKKHSESSESIENILQIKA